MEDVKTQLQALIKEPEADITWLKSDQTALFGLQKDYIITYVDKAANIFAFICKKHYIKNLIQEYKLPTYKVSQLPLQDILNLHHTYTRKLGITFNKEAYNKVAYAYTSHKATKVTADVRYIAGSYMCSLQPLSVHINMILNKLKPKIYQIWNTKLKNNNTTALRIWMLKHSAEVPYRIKLFNRTYNYPAQRPILLESYDVKTLYTNIPHKDLLTKIWELFECISSLSKHQDIMIASNRMGCKLVYGNRIDHLKSVWKQFYSLRDVMHMIEFLVSHTYVMVNDKCFQQLIGIPMGTNAGVNIVDFYLAKYELDFMIQILNKQQWNMLNKFKTTMRYLDDILSVENDSFKQLLRRIKENLSQLCGYSAISG